MVKFYQFEIIGETFKTYTMKLRRLKKPRRFRGLKKYGDFLIIKFKYIGGFGILKKIDNKWMLGYIPYKDKSLSKFDHEPILEGNSFLIKNKTVPISRIMFPKEVLYFYINTKLKFSLGFAKKENIIGMPT